LIYHGFFGSILVIVIKERFLSLLRLVRTCLRVGIYTEPNENIDFIVMDYAFGYDRSIGFRDDMLVVYLNEKYEVNAISAEG